MQTVVNLCNLIQITRLPALKDQWLKMATVNTQSTRHKDLQVNALISDQYMDFLVVTETWLTNNQSDNIWLESTCLNKDHLRMLMKNRVGWKKGCIALIYKKEYSVKIIKKWHQVIISILNLVCECKKQALNYNQTLSSSILHNESNK